MFKNKEQKPTHSIAIQVPSCSHVSSVQRETVESIVIAVILAFLFRAFVAEAFIIPTGSMAPTLMGKHKDVVCPKCEFPFRAGASSEDDEQSPRSVIAAMCPQCRHTLQLDLFANLDHDSFSGDRILVSKFSYDMSPPKRWDVIVFKFPNNAKQNYIKRLIGLPNERLQIFHGDIYVQDGKGEFAIQRKPAHKIKAMMQLVHDSQFASEQLHEAGFPVRWQPSSTVDQELWSGDKLGKQFETDGKSSETTWMRYNHIVPKTSDWEALDKKQPLRNLDRKGKLITDFYAYNATANMYSGDVTPRRYNPEAKSGRVDLDSQGRFWVGDLVVETEVAVKSEDGKILLDLVEAGRHHTCTLDVKTGEATLQIAQGKSTFNDGKKSLKGKTKLKGPGTYQLRFSNLDNELMLWVNDKVVEFDGSTIYEAPDKERPAWSQDDAGDLTPVGIGSQGAKFKVNHAKVYRDVYYVATDKNRSSEYTDNLTQTAVHAVFEDPESWATHRIFDSRTKVSFEMEEDQFFPLGDNSPESYDARSWTGVQFVDKELMIGKALLIYWPHPLYHPIPFFPNFARMGLIR